MTPEATSHFRRLMKLRDYQFLDETEAKAAFNLCVSTAAWAVKQMHSESSEWDSFFEQAREEDPSRLIGLLSYLATIDVRFFELHKRMIARDLWRRNPTPYVRQTAAYFLTQKAPKSRRVLARDVAITLGVCSGFGLGLKPMESVKKDDAARFQSGCGRLFAKMNSQNATLSYSVIEKVWVKRANVLEDAGFPKSECRTFFKFFSDDPLD